MAIIGAIIIGFIVGLLARMLKPGDDSAGFLLTTGFGIGGAFLGTFLGRGLGLYQETEVAGFFMSLIGAILVIAIFHLVRGRKKA